MLVNKQLTLRLKMENQLRSLKTKILNQDPIPNPPPPAPTPPSPFAPLSKINIDVPNAVVDAQNNLGALIVKTQSLLHRVKGSVAASSTVGVSSKTSLIYEPPNTRKKEKHQDMTKTTPAASSLSSNYPFQINRDVKLRETEFGLREGTYSYSDGDLNDVELLLNGVPDAYETEVSYDDEEIEKILKQGGTAPSQLEYPALYTANQKIMDKLKNVDTLQIRFTRFLVYSAKFGIRMDGAFLIVRTPRSYPMTDTYSEAHRMDLPEIRKVQFLGMKKEGIIQFFVGEVELNKTLTVPIKVDDDLIRMWMSGGNAIEIELHSYLAKPGIRRAGVYTEPVIFGRTKIPMEGVLGTQFLDAIVNVDIDADASTHSAVMNRIRALHIGQQIRDPGKKLGILSSQVTLLYSKEKQDTSQKPHNPSRIYPCSQTSKASDILKVSFDNFSVKDARDTTLSYIPEEKTEEGISFPSLHSQKFQQLKVEPSNDVSKVSPQLEGATRTPSVRYYGVGIFQWKWFDVHSLWYHIPRSKAEEILEGFSLTYKFSLRHSEEVVAKFRSNPCDQVQSVGLGKIMMVPKNAVDCPIVELSILSKSPTGRSGEVTFKSAVIAKSKAIYSHIEGQLFSIILYDTRTLKPSIALDCICFQGTDGFAVQQEVQKALNSFPSVLSGSVDVNDREAATTRTSTVKQEGDDSHSVVQPNETILVAENMRESFQSVLSEDSLSRKSDRDQISCTTPSATESHCESSDVSIADIISCLNHSNVSPVSSFQKLSQSTARDSIELLPPSKSKPSIHDETSRIIMAHINESQSSRNSADDQLRVVATDEPVDVPCSLNTLVSSAKASQTLCSHLWDISVHGNVPTEHVVGSSNSVIIGCHICYSLPALQSIDTNPASFPTSLEVLPETTATKISFNQKGLTQQSSAFSIWWDGECAILNTTNRHRFLLPSTGIDGYAIGKALGINPVAGLELFIFESDDNGNLPLDSRPIAKAVLPTYKLIELFSENCTDVLLSLSVTTIATVQSLDSLVADLDTIVFKISHRVEPVLLRLSTEKQLLPIPKEDDCVIQENKSHAKAGRENEDFLIPKDPEHFYLKNEIPQLMPRQDEELQSPHFTILLDQVAHLRTMSSIEGSKLFLSLEISDGLKSKDLTKMILFTGLESIGDQVTFRMQFSVPCRRSHDGEGFMERIAKSSLILNAYERLPLFPASSVFINQNDLSSELASYPPSSVRITDKFLGAAIVDLSLLAIGMPFIEGWYHFLDPLQKSFGQIKVKVHLNEDEPVQISNYNSFDSNTVISLFNWSSTSRAKAASETKLEEEEYNGISLRSSANVSEAHDLRLSYQVDESLIDIKAMEYDSLKKLLHELDETKEKLLQGFLNQHIVDENVAEHLENEVTLGKDTFPCTNRNMTAIGTNFLEDVVGLEFESLGAQGLDDLQSIEDDVSLSCNSYSSDFESHTSSQTWEMLDVQHLTAALESPQRVVTEDFVGDRSSFSVLSDQQSGIDSSVVENQSSSSLVQSALKVSAVDSEKTVQNENLTEPIENNSWHSNTERESNMDYEVVDESFQSQSMGEAWNVHFSGVTMAEIDDDGTQSPATMQEIGFDPISSVSNEVPGKQVRLIQCECADALEDSEEVDSSFGEKVDESIKEHHLFCQPQEFETNSDTEQNLSFAVSHSEDDDPVDAHSRSSRYEDSNDTSNSALSDLPSAENNPGDGTNSSLNISKSNSEINEEESARSAKILYIVDEELEKLVSERKLVSMNDLATPVGSQDSSDVAAISVPESRQNSKLLSKVEIVDISQVQKSLDLGRISAPVSQPAVINNPCVFCDTSMKKSDVDVIKDSLQLMHCQIEKSKRRQMTDVKKLPGRQKAFVDAETERVSKIMMGVLRTPS